MNTDQMTPVVRRWLRHTEATPPDARQSARQVMARMPYVRQRGRWLPFPLFHRKARTATVTDTTEYQPTPIPATNTHALTIIGRTQTMFSPVKAITAGALIFALGGVLFIAQPFDQQGGVPGAEQGAEPPAPVKVTATFVGLDCEPGSGGTEPTYEEDGLISRGYGGSCTVYREWSDPRLQGTETSIVNGVDYRDDSELFIAHYVHDIVTDEGAWRMRPQFRFDAETRYSSGIWVLDGEDAYEGLSVVLAMDAHTFAPLTGYIISTDLVPPAPEGASTK